MRLTPEIDRSWAENCQIKTNYILSRSLSNARAAR